MAEPTEKKPPKPRPLSPHLQVYRLPFTAILSIAHRITGVGMTLGLGLFAWWLYAVMAGSDAFQTYHMVVRSWPGKIVFAGFAFALSYHMLNGIRHLYWDTGRGITVEAAQKSGLAVVISALVIALFICYVGYNV